MNLSGLFRFAVGITFMLVLLTPHAKAQHLDSISNAIDAILNEKNSTSANTAVRASTYRADTARISRYLAKGRSFRSDSYDSLRINAQKALALSFKTENLAGISQATQLLGQYYMMKEDYASATKCFLKSIAIEEKLNNTHRIADLNDELGTVYFYQEIFNKALAYYTSALAEYEQARDTMNMAKVYSHLGNLHSSHEFCENRTTEQKRADFTTAIQYFQKAISLGKSAGYQPLIINSYVNLAAVYNKLDKAEIALSYLKKATTYYRGTKNMGRLSEALYTMGITYFKLKQYKNAIEAYNESLKIGVENKQTEGIQYLYEAMAQTYYSNKDYKNAYNYYIKYMTIRDSLVTAEKARQVFELETSYQTEKKEKEILKLTSEKNVRNILLFALAGLLSMMAVASYFIVKNIRNKKLIAEQTIAIKEQYIQDLEKERLLVATKSVLKGEESERSRMARDLHDGLGGLLSGVKINLSAMKGNSIITSENVQAFDHALKLLDTSISELRRVAHNLMPETLNHYGLKTALNDFIREMGNNPAIMLTFSFFGADIRFESQLELTTYRIAQELVNNALKHAEATKIDLQLIADIDRVCIQVVDNGKGFDTKCNPCEGKGLFVIRDRVTAYNGTFELESTPGHGTEASVEFLLS